MFYDLVQQTAAAIFAWLNPDFSRCCGYANQSCSEMFAKPDLFHSDLIIERGFSDLVQGNGRITPLFSLVSLK